MRSSQLAQTALFSEPEECQTSLEQASLSYSRAQAISKTYGLTAEDLTVLSQKFWDFHADNVICLDSAAFTILTVHFNLAAGTLAPHAERRRELRPLLKQLLDFEVSGVFLLTEVAHGLDARNIETTATLLPSGGFDLHTPRPEASKFMPSSIPINNLPRVGIVIARLIKNGEDYGLHPFVVPLNDGKKMCKGVTSRLLPKRAGKKSIDHCLTSFNHVRLPKTALLGDVWKAKDARQAFLDSTWRIAIGSLSLAFLAIPFTSVAAYIAARYSLRRTVVGPAGQDIPIWSFRTQQLPILQALAQAAVARPYLLEAANIMRNIWLKKPVDDRALVGIAVTAKAVLLERMKTSLNILTERCGAQGLFDENQLIAMQIEVKGAVTAEGDVLTVSIKLASELLIGRLRMPPSRHPNCLLARHEASLFAECQQFYNKAKTHRGEEHNRFLLPLSLPLVEAIGHRMAYEAALDAGVHKPLLDLYEASVVKQDAAWYSENAGITRAQQREMEDRAVTAAVPHLEQYLQETEAEPYARAPMLSKGNWDNFVAGLECFTGMAELHDLGTALSFASYGDEFSPRARL